MCNVNFCVKNLTSYFAFPNFLYLQRDINLFSNQHFILKANLLAAKVTLISMQTAATTTTISTSTTTTERGKSPGVNFTNIWRAAFTHADPKSLKIQWSCHYLLALLWSESIKASLNTLMKLTPVVNFINVKSTNFMYEAFF